MGRLNILNIYVYAKVFIRLTANKVKYMPLKIVTRNAVAHKSLQLVLN